MKSFIKIYGPPVLKGIRVLETVGIDMPEVCIMDSLIEALLRTAKVTQPIGTSLVMNYFESAVPKPRFEKIICKSGEKIGDYDFFFEWIRNPTIEEIQNLIEKIDTAFETLGCRYTITTN